MPGSEIEALYDDVFRSYESVASKLLVAGTESLPRLVATLGRQISSPDVGRAFFRYGHVFDDAIHHVGCFSPSITGNIHRVLTSEYLINRIPYDCDQIIELGGGWGANLFHVWLGGGPRTAEYVSLELSGAGRALSEKISKLEPALRFSAHQVDILDLNLAHIATGKRAFIFSCDTLSLIRELPADFFRRLLAGPGVVGGAHVEPGAWQVRPPSMIHARSQAYTHANQRNFNLFDLLEEAHSARLLQVEEFLPNHHCANPLAPYALVHWTRGGARRRSHYQMGQRIDFSSSADLDSFGRDGWSHPEKWGCWTDGPRARLSIAVDGVPPGDTALVVEGMAFVPPGQEHLEIIVNANGVEVARWQFSGTRQVVEAKLPSSIWRPFGILDLSFVMPDAQSPLELGISPDERRLGLGLSALSVVKAQ